MNSPIGRDPHNPVHPAPPSNSKCSLMASNAPALKPNLELSWNSSAERTTPCPNVRDAESTASSLKRRPFPRLGRRSSVPAPRSPCARSLGFGVVESGMCQVVTSSACSSKSIKASRRWTGRLMRFDLGIGNGQGHHSWRVKWLHPRRIAQLGSKCKLSCSTAWRRSCFGRNDATPEGLTKGPPWCSSSTGLVHEPGEGVHQTGVPDGGSSMRWRPQAR